MNEAESARILYPVFAMFLLVSIVLLRMRSQRFAAVRKQEVDAAFYKAYPDGGEPESLRVIGRHFSNLFEMPVLFYAVVLMIYVTRHVSTFLVSCAWLYVALRYLHSYIHLGSNDVIARFSVYFASAFVLAVMWATLLVQLLRAG
jgi:hypothetical protein